MYPENDTKFEETTVDKVSKEPEGWSIKLADGWSFYVPQNSPIEPKEGMVGRFYGNGIGSSVRGFFLNEVKVFYRTEKEEKEYREIQQYGADATDWLKRWDEGETVWTIEMGGLGPGYEQCIAITTAEILRIMLLRKYDTSKWREKESWKQDREEIEKYVFKNQMIDKLGLSGAQWEAALNVASNIYQRGPRVTLTDERVKDRHIQVSRIFP